MLARYSSTFKKLKPANFCLVPTACLGSHDERESCVRECQSTKEYGSRALIFGRWEDRTPTSRAANARGCGNRTCLPGGNRRSHRGASGSAGDPANGLGLVRSQVQPTLGGGDVLEAHQAGKWDNKNIAEASRQQHRVGASRTLWEEDRSTRGGELFEVGDPDPLVEGVTMSETDGAYWAQQCRSGKGAESRATRFCDGHESERCDTYHAKRLHPIAATPPLECASKLLFLGFVGNFGTRLGLVEPSRRGLRLEEN
ncbi:hypothetical protein C8F04DRAFT_1179551 [Mycena alexandri]|uniref:Uncharacterized protein n=1 Tax=Mycena alexandri TaxID=1745969 RepID=A0AAD6T716_9AGAR|nr:hypothetical protein C8F04DRAFT_1179551 [Mycena alexandri]